MRERGLKVIEKFKQVIFIGVEDPKLSAILEDLKNYWTDLYRPTLTSLSCEAVGGEPDATIKVSLMVTLAGVGIGIHDDIVDQSKTKHFKRTILGLHGPKYSLFVGDLLVLKALTMVRELVGEDYQTEKILDIIKALEQFLMEIYNGELMEIKCIKNLDIDLEFLQLALWKLGADLKACAKLGGIIGDGSNCEVEALAQFGHRLGYLTRLVDEVKDCLNLEGNLSHKLQYESIPLPILYASKVSKENLHEIKSILERSTIPPSAIRRLVELCFEAEAFKYVSDIAKKNVEEAVQKLDTLKPSNAREALKTLLEKSLLEIEKMSV